MKKILKFLFILISLVFLVYLWLPGASFPDPPPDALQSDEPADTENPLRRAYFTDYTREEVMNHYVAEMSKQIFLGIKLPTYRLNYPPEEAWTLIRDQTRSTFLEEVLHPFRESVFVNGFEPKEEKDTIFIQNRKWRQKLTIRHVPSSLFVRVGLGILTLALILELTKEWILAISYFNRLKR